MVSCCPEQLSSGFSVPFVLMTVSTGEIVLSPWELLCGIPLMSFLSSMLFNIYMRPWIEFICTFGVGCYQYTSAMWVYNFGGTKPPDSSSLSCISTSNRWGILIFNLVKMEVILLRSRWYCMLIFDCVRVSNRVRSLWILPDEHVEVVVKCAFYHLPLFHKT